MPMQVPSQITDALKSLKETGRIAPGGKITCQGLATGIKVDGVWRRLDEIVALVGAPRGMSLVSNVNFGLDDANELHAPMRIVRRGRVSFRDFSKKQPLQRD